MKLNQNEKSYKYFILSSILYLSNCETMRSLYFFSNHKNPEFSKIETKYHKKIISKWCLLILQDDFHEYIYSHIV